MTSTRVVDDVAGLTPEWLTDVLAHSGHEGIVRAVTARPVGTGQMGSTYRLDIEYARGGGPTRLVVKLPSADPSIRAAGAMSYRAESLFYRKFAESLQVRVPHCYLAEISDDACAFTLVLEDMAPAEQGDQIAGCTVDQARAAALNVAGLHAPTWCDPSLRQLDGVIPSPADSADFVAGFFRDAAEQFLARHTLQDPTRRVLQKFAERYVDWATGRPEPFCLVHNDYRLDNLLFAPAGGPDSVIAVDWQVLSVGLPLNDVALLVATGLPTEVRPAAERGIVEAYRRALLHFGVEGYDSARCWDDYRHALFYPLHLTVFGAFTANVTERGGRMFTVMAERAVAAITDLDCFSIL